MPISGTRPPGANSPGTPTRMSHPRLPGSNTTVTRARLPGTRPTPPSIDRYANIQFIRFLPLNYHPNTFSIQLEIYSTTYKLLNKSRLPVLEWYKGQDKFDSGAARHPEYRHLHPGLHLSQAAVPDITLNLNLPRLVLLLMIIRAVS